jgi:hypothetical protein
LHQLAFGLHRTGTGHDDKAAAADLEVSDPDYGPKLFVVAGHQIETGKLPVPVWIHDGAELSCPTTKKL